ncbi:MAG: hypothetical protein ACEPOV_02415 [Hyphomicrobiales bacterium]
MQNKTKPTASKFFSFYKLSRMLVIAMIGLIAFGGVSSCCGKKCKEEKAAEALRLKRIEQAKKDLTAILNDEVDWSLDQKEDRVKTIEGWNLNDTEVNDLLAKVKDKLAKERAEWEELQKKKAAEAKRKALMSQLENQFKAIAQAPDFNSANNRINNTIALFSNENVPVLIVIAQNGDLKDYDKPTTVGLFLNYVKDTKNYNFAVQNFVADANGKITELELIKK